MNDEEIREILKAVQKKKRKYSKRIVALVILLNVVFTIAMIYTFIKVGSEPAALIVAFFGFTTVELWAMSKIKRDEIKEGEEEDEL